MLTERQQGFSLVELLVAMAVSVLLMALLFGVLSQVSRATRKASDSSSAFDEARIAFAEMKYRLSQATLSPYWNVSYDSSGNPSGYYRLSDLHFISGYSDILLPASYQTQGSAIFFQAVTGFDPARTGEGSALNAEGFFVEFRDVNADKPLGLASARWRFQLRSFRQPAYELGIFDLPKVAGVSKKIEELTEAEQRSWFQSPLGVSSAPVTTLANNVALLVVRVRTSEGSAGMNYYGYDSRSWAGSGNQPETSHQLPPVVDVVMLALEARFADRIANGSTQPQLVPPGIFTNPDNLDEDVADLESHLSSSYEQSGYRIFRASVPIRSAKWSTDSTVSLP